ncbi:MAG: beta-ketoacyl-[acyl-carrier-protein] synthase II [Planctomycetota bacterium]
MRKRAVVTGIGCVSPVGNDPTAAWNAVCLGKSGVAPITRFDASGFPTRIAAEVKDFSLSQWCDAQLVGEYERSGRNIQYGIAAALQAVRDSGLDYNRLSDPSRFGVYLGSGEGAQNFDTYMGMVAEAHAENGTLDVARFAELGLQRLDPQAELDQEPNMLAARIASQFNAQGPNLNTLTACAASAQAIGEGAEMIRCGTADIMIVGGSHSMIHPFGMTGFCLLNTLSTRNDDPTAASRPFDRERDGFVLGEGAAMLVIEEYSHAKNRGAPIYGEILGYGVAADAYRITDIPADGNGLSRAMQHALRDAGLNGDQVSYVNAHGTSTGANDRSETNALKGAFAAHAHQLPISSTKSMTGHLVAACGALEAMFSLLAMRDAIVPPTANYQYPDPDCDLDYVPNHAREQRLTTVMSNNSGFGGQNVSLVLSRI